MMKTIGIISFATILFSGITLHAQAPGYMGKHLSFYYEPAFFPGLNGSEFNSFTINLRHDISVDYVISRGTAIGASYQYLATRMDDAILFPKVGDDLYFSGDIGLHASMVGIYIKLFSYRKHGSIAPEGHYNKLELLFYTAHVHQISADSALLADYAYGPSTNDFSDLGYPDIFHQGAFIYTFGTQLLHFDKMYISAAAQIGFTFPAFSLRDGLNYETEPAVFKQDAEARIEGAMFLNFSVGIGLLAI